MKKLMLLSLSFVAMGSLYGVVGGPGFSDARMGSMTLQPADESGDSGLIYRTLHVHVGELPINLEAPIFNALNDPNFRTLIHNKLQSLTQPQKDALQNLVSAIKNRRLREAHPEAFHKLKGALHDLLSVRMQELKGTQAAMHLQSAINNLGPVMPAPASIPATQPVGPEKK